MTPAFEGHGCAVSKASTSVLVESMDQQTLQAVRDRCRQFIAFAQGSAECPSFDERLEAFSAVRAHPARLKCATLSWESVLLACERLLIESQESM